MKNQIELLAPGGDIDSIKAAILAGANAVYCGLEKFNARSQAKNISLEDMNGILRLAHKFNCEVFLTLNIIIIEREIPALITLLNKLVNTSLDGIIIQDLGVFYLINKYFPSLKIHASTQMTTHNEGQIKFLSKLKATRVNLSRELNIHEITALTSVAHEHNVLTEVFVHGSNCISFSGLCYMSSVTGGNSGNRGQCSQPCRDEYLTTAEGKNFPLNIKDNSAFSDLKVLADAGVDSVKIEGRIKKYHYVYTVVETWRKQLDSFYQENEISDDQGNLRKVFNRDFSNSFLQGDMSRDIFIDNPRDNSATYLAKNWQGSIDENLSKAKKVLFDQKSQIITNVESRIAELSIEKEPLIITLSGKEGSLLTVTVKTPDDTFTVTSDINLVLAEADSNGGINHDLITKRFKSLNDTGYFIETLDLDECNSALFIQYKELTLLANKISFVLRGEKERIAAIDIPVLKNSTDEKIIPSLSLLISSETDLHLCDETLADIYFQLPNHFSDKVSKYVALFKNNSRLIPWFPSVLIGTNYIAAVELLEQLKPKRIVTNNSGVAYTAYEKGISWTAGPYMNLVNSYSLLCLKEQFNCEGAFISNEINQSQIKKIVKPDNFKLTYSISHPIVLMTTIACMFHQVTGCKKNIVDDKCIQRCKKSSSITNLKDVTYFIDKEKGGYHTVYNESNFLNIDIIKDIPDMFTTFFIDLRDIKTETKTATDKTEVVKLFERHINGSTESIDELKQNIFPSTSTQYSKGI
ncbi:MAG: peptidase U32 family protein [Woeseiaceae bacterium]